MDWLARLERLLIGAAVSIFLAGGVFLAGAEYSHLHARIHDLKVANEILKQGHRARDIAAGAARIDILRNDGFRRTLVGPGGL